MREKEIERERKREREKKSQQAQSKCRVNLGLHFWSFSGASSEFIRGCTFYTNFEVHFGPLQSVNRKTCIRKTNKRASRKPCAAIQSKTNTNSEIMGEQKALRHVFW